MLDIIVGVFFILHGLVHLLYSGQSARLFELQAGMVWPDGSWAFSRRFGDEATRVLASVLLILATIGFVVGGIGIFVAQEWWRPVVVSTAAFSAVIFTLLWDGEMQALANRGLIGILINLVILIAILILKWPRFGF